MELLKQELKELLVAVLNLEDVSPGQISDGEALFGGGLGLDSIDALELAVAVERRYQVTIPDATAGRTAFASIEALAAYIERHRVPAGTPPE
jgi:acyl carrier protein